jgi:prepilin-type N-terminal cleavage/methylation domain-containing protein
MISQKGFTLIETIVVGVIIVILAAIAIPLYSGFLRDARQNTVDNLAQTAAAAANAYYRKTGDQNPPALTNLSLFYDSSEYLITVGASDITVRNKNHSAATKTVPYK